MKILKQCRAIVVEDDPTAAQNITDLMELFFGQVCCFGDAESALEIYDPSTCSVILTDIQLPGMDGLELISHIRARGDENTQIIVLTSFVTTEYLRTAIPLGLVEYLEKPISFDALKNVLERCSHNLLKTGRIFHQISKEFLFNPQTFQLHDGEKNHSLTKRESLYLRLLCEHRGNYLSKEFLLEQLWRDEEGSDAALRNLTLRLRKKLGDSSDLLLNHPGYGYTLKEKSGQP